MRQLGELQKHADEFKNLNAEMLFVFREETEGVEGLKKIKDKHQTSYLLSLDLDKKNSKPYSPEKMTFDNYVVDSKGTIRGIIDGTLRDRATAEELMKILKEIEKGD